MQASELVARTGKFRCKQREWRGPTVQIQLQLVNSTHLVGMETSAPGKKVTQFGAHSLEPTVGHTDRQTTTGREFKRDILCPNDDRRWNLSVVAARGELLGLVNLQTMATFMVALIALVGKRKLNKQTNRIYSALETELYVRPLKPLKPSTCFSLSLLCNAMESPASRWASTGDVHRQTPVSSCQWGRSA